MNVTHADRKQEKTKFEYVQLIVHRLGFGETVVVGEQVTLRILLPFLRNISFRMSCEAQTLFMSYHRLLTVVLACVVVVGGRVNLLRL
jgi:hypothetical protein